MRTADTPLRLAPLLIALLMIPLLTLLSACAGDEPGDSDVAESAPDNTEEVAAAYAADPDFYTFATLDDLPPELSWEDGGDLPEIGSPNAIKGGTQYSALPDFPRTLRISGPDANGSFRPFILDHVVMLIAPIHPETLSHYPGLAESWALDRDSSTVYFKINPAARWSDGEPVTAEDFMFMFWMYRSPYIRAPWYNNWYSTQYTNITRYDDHTVSITTASQKPDFHSKVLELHPMPRHFFRELGEDYVERYQWRFVPTTGAYVVRDEDIKKGRSITLTRTENWWAKDNKYWRYRFNPDRVQFSIIRDVAKGFEAFKRGDLDRHSLALAEYWYEKLPNSHPDVQAGYIAKSEFYNNYPRPPMGLWINTAQPLLNDLNVRRGIQYASNWDLVIDQYFRGDAVRLRTPQEGFTDFSNPAIEPRAFDINAAQRYFAAAGFSERGPDGILLNAAGQRLAFTLTTGYESLKDVLTILKQEAAKAGLEFRIEVLDGTASWKKVQEKKHEITLVAFGGFLEMYPRFWEHYHSVNAYEDAFLADGSANPERKLKTQTNNLESFALPEMDQLIDAYRASTDEAEMVQISHQIQQLHHEQASWVPGYYDPSLRLGHWRWVQFPEFFNHRYVRDVSQLWVHWIDTDLKAEVLEARKTGKTFPPMIEVFDQWKP